jgi:hypothetical protein
MKKFYYITTFILFIVTIFCFSNVSNSAYLYGDVNLDGKVTSNDYYMIRNFLSGARRPSTVQSKLADVDYNGKITSADANIVFQMVNGGRMRVFCPPR